jgi:hypothetical protein
MGDVITNATAQANCDPIVHNSDIDKIYAFDNTTLLNKYDIAIPCGLIAKSVFNDTYTMARDSALKNEIDINSNDIAWQSDRDYKFKNQPGDWQKV